MRIARLSPEHLESLKLQEAQSYLSGDILGEGYAQRLMAGEAFTAFVENKVIGCAGCIEQWDNRAIAWALISPDAGRHMLTFHRAVSGFLMQSKWRRIEAFVDSEFKAGHRWIQMLGFELEGRMRSFSPSGLDFDLYARIRREE